MKISRQRLTRTLRRIFLGRAAIVTGCVVAAYLLGGFFLVPALAKWQLVKQVEERLGHGITVGEVRFNPLKFSGEIRDLELRAPEGGALVAFKRLFVDFEVSGVTERAWTFAEIALEQPVVTVSRDGQGGLNFQPLVDALAGPNDQPKEGPPPRLRVERALLSEARIEFSDQRLPEPLLARIAPLTLELTNLSTLPSSNGRFRLTARSDAGETLDWTGTLGLDPIVFEGELLLKRLQVATLARAFHDRITVAAPRGTIDLSTRHRFAVDSQGLAGGLERLQLGVEALQIGAPKSETPLLALESFELADASLDLAKREVVVPRLALRKGRLALQIDERGQGNWRSLLKSPAVEGSKVPAATTTVSGAKAPVEAETSEWRLALEALEVDDVALQFADRAAGSELQAGSLRARGAAIVEFGARGVKLSSQGPRVSVSDLKYAAGKERVEFAAATLEGASLSVSAAGSKLEIDLKAAKGSLPSVIARQAGNALDLKGVAIEGPRLSVVAAEGDLRVDLAAPKLVVAGSDLRQGEARATLQNVEFLGERIALRGASGKLQVSADKARLVLASGALRQGSNAIALSNASFRGEHVAFANASGEASMALAGTSLALADLRVREQGAKDDWARLGKMQLRANSIGVTLPPKAFDVLADGIMAEVKTFALHDRASAAQLANLGSAQVSGASLRLRDRAIAIDRVSLADGIARIVMDSRGRINWAQFAGDAKSQESASRERGAAAEPAWRLAAKSVQLKDIAAEFADLQTDPAFLAGLTQIEASVQNLDTAGPSPARLELSARVRQGGRLSASGTVNAASGQLDLEVKLDELSLAPAQPYLRKFTHLELASGNATLAGRVRTGLASPEAALVFEGSARVEQLGLEQTAPRQPFFSWDSVAASGLKLALAPNRLEIAELRLAAPSGRFLIAEDQSVNLTAVLKRDATPGDAVSPEQPASAENMFPISIARLRIERGALEFGDDSLQPRFQTRMHGLKGIVVGFGTAPGSRATVQLEARVDEFGSARIKGEIEPLAPRAFTDISMTFRNLEMSALGPYVTKFAGYRVAGGKLAMDLRYRIKEQHLAGENNIVLTKLELGEKVDSPSAIDVPLELAIALLKNADGVIDIDLPVAGDLQDPKFDYGAVIGKAIGNLIVGIVAAPFKALAALFGGDSRDLDSIDFEPGVASLAPPERGKLQIVARALRERPELRLTVDPVFAPGADREALKSVAVRRAVLARMGVALAADEDPGPLDLANEPVRRALEAEFAAKHPEAAERGPAPAASKDFHRGLLDRLIREHSLEDAALRELARERGAAIVAELTTEGGVEAARVTLAEAVAAEAGDAGVAAKLELGAGR